MELTTKGARDFYAALYDLAGRDHKMVHRALEPVGDRPVTASEAIDRIVAERIDTLRHTDTGGKDGDT